MIKNKKIISAAKVLKEKLLKCKIDTLDLDSYYLHYIKHYLQDLDSILYRYCWILEKILEEKNLDSVFTDFGAGSGVLSFLAKLAGFKKVIYVDIQESNKNSAEKLADELGIEISNFIVSSYENIENKIDEKIDIIANYDVLEHLYNPKLAFENLTKILNENGLIFMASGANTYQPILNYFLKRKQKIFELKGWNGEEAYLDQRFQFIKENSNNYTNSQIYAYAKKTRGLMFFEIKKLLDSNKIENFESQVTVWNTCDPKTGNWCENLIPYFDLKKDLEKVFSKVDLFPGVYPEVKTTLNEIDLKVEDRFFSVVYKYLHFLMIKLSKILNLKIELLPGRSKFIVAPFYCILAKR